MDLPVVIGFVIAILIVGAIAARVWGRGDSDTSGR